MPPSDLGLPDAIESVLFDLDGVLTHTASVHAAAWKETFDAFLAQQPAADGTEPTPFDIATDYLRHVDGRVRSDGVRTFLASRGITLPEGSPDDPATAPTVNGLGNRKNELLLEVLARDGVEVFPGSRRYVEAVRDAGLAIAVVSASANAASVLEAGGLATFIDVRIDGVVAAERSMRGKPAPDTFLAAAEQLGTAPSAAAVFEDALAGVQAGRAGAFAYVVGVDRGGQAAALEAAGADIVVDDLAELLDQ